MPLILIAFTIIVISLTWARFKFFRVKSANSKFAGMIYDPIALTHVGTTYWYLFTTNSVSNSKIYLASVLYFIALSIFIWAASSVNNLNFAFSNNVSKFCTNGAFKLVRHPFYFSYILIWFTSTLLFNSYILWITLSLLVCFYTWTSILEETSFLRSQFAPDYIDYKKETGMFFPRVAQWKKWFLSGLNQILK